MMCGFFVHWHMRCLPYFLNFKFKEGVTKKNKRRGTSFGNCNNINRNFKLIKEFRGMLLF